MEGLLDKLRGRADESRLTGRVLLWAISLIAAVFALWTLRGRSGQGHSEEVRDAVAASEDESDRASAAEKAVVEQLEQLSTASDKLAKTDREIKGIEDDLEATLSRIGSARSLSELE